MSRVRRARPPARSRARAKNADAPSPSPHIEDRIVVLRGRRVMLDADLAELYEVTTKRLNEQVKRNRDRFPADFMLRLTRSEVEALNRSQFATGSQRHRDPRSRPYAFTEHGAVMLATVLKSRSAVRASVFVVRAFVRLRHFARSCASLARRLDDLERRFAAHDSTLEEIFEAVRALTLPPLEPERRVSIGFRPRADGE